MSIRNDIEDTFVFPEKQELTVRLKDVLETDVDEKYYLSDEQVAGFIQTTEKAKAKGNGFRFEPTAGDGYAKCIATRPGQRQTDNYISVAGRLDIKGQDQIKRVYEPHGVSPTLSTMGGVNRQPKVLEAIVVASRGMNPDNPSDRTTGAPTVQILEPKFDGTTNTITTVQKDNYIAIKTANTKGYDVATDGDGIDLNYPDSKTRRGRVGHGVSKTIPTGGGSQGVLDGFRIRKLTPKECWRLMGFDDTDFEKAEKVNSNTQLYKQAGNSIVVDVLEAILGNLIKEK